MPAARRQPAGLCDACRHQRLVPNTRGSVFSLCERSRVEPGFPRYPRVPVLRCPGFEPDEPTAGDEPTELDGPTEGGEPGPPAI